MLSTEQCSPLSFLRRSSCTSRFGFFFSSYSTTVPTICCTIVFADGLALIPPSYFASSTSRGFIGGTGHRVQGFLLPSSMGRFGEGGRRSCLTWRSPLLASRLSFVSGFWVLGFVASVGSWLAFVLFLHSRSSLLYAVGFFACTTSKVMAAVCFFNMQPVVTLPRLPLLRFLVNFLFVLISLQRVVRSSSLPS
jgi:hypothetical protein